MSRLEPDELEQRLVLREPTALPPELRMRVLASMHRASEEVERAQPSFVSYVLPAAAAVLICANLFLTLFLGSNRPPWDRTEPVQGAAPLAMSASLTPGISERDIHLLAFLLSANSHSTRPPLLSTPSLRNLLHEESSSWNTTQ